MISQRQSGDAGDRGKNLGQGLADIDDNPRRDLAGRGGDARHQDPRASRTGDRRESGDADRGRAPGRSERR